MEEKNTLEVSEAVEQKSGKSECIHKLEINEQYCEACKLYESLYPYLLLPGF
jgi:hypothetical protein